MSSTSRNSVHSPGIYIIADTHFGDENIRLYEERPFQNTDEMDHEMIRRWNETVTDDDLVYHLEVTNIL